MKLIRSSVYFYRTVCKTVAFVYTFDGCESNRLIVLRICIRSCCISFLFDIIVMGRRVIVDSAHVLNNILN